MAQTRTSGNWSAPSLRFLGDSVSEVALRLVQMFSAFTSIGVGGWMLGRGPQAFLSPTWDVPRWVAPYWAWGLMFLAFGVALAIASAGHHRYAVWGSFFNAGLAMFFAMSLLGSIIFEDPVGPTTPIAAGSSVAVYSGFAAITLISGVGLAWEELDRVLVGMKRSLGLLVPRLRSR